MRTLLRRLSGLLSRRKAAPNLSRQLLERLDTTNQLLAQICVLLAERQDANIRAERYANNRLLIVILFSLLLGAPGAVVAMLNPALQPARDAAFATPVEVFNKIVAVFLGG